MEPEPLRFFFSSLAFSTLLRLSCDRMDASKTPVETRLGGRNLQNSWVSIR